MHMHIVSRRSVACGKGLAELCRKGQFNRSTARNLVCDPLPLVAQGFHRLSCLVSGGSFH
jgi:hypothetical protein